MKKIIACSALIIISCIANNVHAQSAKDAIMALKKLQAKTQSGIAYREYRNALGETKFPTSLFFESSEATKNLALAESIKKAMNHYEVAGRLWENKINDLKFGRYIEADSDQGEIIEKLYPAANQDIKNGGAIFNRTIVNINRDTMKPERSYKLTYDIDQLLPLIWNEVSKELDNTSLLLSKISNEPEENKLGDIEKLNREIKLLNDEIMILRTENQALRLQKK